jgi:16S rRNA (uracil1498-N3)-methyltransferase
MSVPRFYCPPPLFVSDSFELPAAAAHHASRVLRLRVGDSVQIFDGIGHAFDATLSELIGKRVLLNQLKSCVPQAVSPLRLVLAQAMCSSEKMDWIVQKATELGVSEIYPVQAERSVARLQGERAEKRVEHWRSVALAACEQCGRNDLPEIHPPQEVKAWLQSMKVSSASKFIFLPTGAVGLHSQTKPIDQVVLLIGPEGGFTTEEAGLAQQMAFVPTLLGPRVLRTETAALAGLSVIQMLWGDFCN